MLKNRIRTSGKRKMVEELLPIKDKSKEIQEYLKKLESTHLTSSIFPPNFSESPVFFKKEMPKGIKIPMIDEGNAVDSIVYLLKHEGTEARRSKDEGKIQRVIKKALHIVSLLLYLTDEDAEGITPEVFDKCKNIQQYDEGSIKSSLDYYSCGLIVFSQRLFEKIDRYNERIKLAKDIRKKLLANKERFRGVSAYDICECLSDGTEYSGCDLTDILVAAMMFVLPVMYEGTKIDDENDRYQINGFAVPSLFNKAQMYVANEMGINRDVYKEGFAFSIELLVKAIPWVILNLRATDNILRNISVYRRAHYNGFKATIFEFFGKHLNIYPASEIMDDIFDTSKSTDDLALRGKNEFCFTGETLAFKQNYLPKFNAY